MLFVSYLTWQSFRSISMTLWYQILDFGITLDDFVCLWVSFPAPFWAQGGTLDTFGSFFAIGSHFDRFAGNQVTHFGNHFGTQILKSCNKHNKMNVKKAVWKSVLPELAQSDRMQHPYCKYHMFWEVEEHLFKKLLISCRLPFEITVWHYWQQVLIWELNKHITNKTSNT